jgi:hypothetical protein
MVMMDRPRRRAQRLMSRGMPRTPRRSPFSLPVFRPEMLPATRYVLSNLDQSALVVTGGMSWIESRSNALMIACLPTSGMEGSAYETHLNVWRRIALRIISFVTPNSPTRSIILARFAAGFLVASRIRYVTGWPRSNNPTRDSAKLH